jgi:hypothetical protein
MFQIRPREKNASCPECQELAREINEAFIAAVRENRPASDALYALIGGDEKDAQLADRLLTPYTYQPAPTIWRLPIRLGEISRRKTAAHQAHGAQVTKGQSVVFEIKRPWPARFLTPKSVFCRLTTVVG